MELANKQLASVVDINDERVVLDANNMAAGKQFEFEVCVEEILRTNP